jgi:hypothetical protein
MQTWATVAAAVVLGLLWAGHLRRERIRDIAFHDAMEQVKQSEEILALLSAPDTIVRVSQEGAAQPPQGKVFLNPKRGVLLLASNLPPAPEGKIYEMWVIPVGGKPFNRPVQSEAKWNRGSPATGPVVWRRPAPWQ